MKEGDIVLVDVGRPNGGFQAELIWIGNIWCIIKNDGQIWATMKSRLTILNDKLNTNE